MTKRHHLHPHEHLQEHLERHFGRGRGGFGGPFGGFGGPFGGPYGGRRGPGGGRARRGNVRAAILALLAERPMHGYEIIQELDSRTQGIWRPSAGSVYPTLQLLEDEGLIAGADQDGKRSFTLTDAGRAHLAEHHPETAPWDEVLERVEPGAHQLRESGMQLAAAVGQVLHGASPEQQKRVAELLAETRRRIYGLLAEETDPR